MNRNQIGPKFNDLLEAICELGITVVTLSDGKVYTEEILDNDPMALILSILIFARANEESAMKALRGKSAWNSKRSKMSDTPLTAKCVGWVKVNKESGKLEAIPQRADIVRRIYKDFLHGSGQQKITDQLVRDKVPVFGKGATWHKSYITKILKNPAVIGSFTPHELKHVGAKKVREPLPEIKNYYPSVVTLDDFYRVQELLKNSSAKGRKVGIELKNVFSYVAKCAKCGAGVVRVTKGKSWVYLVCANGKSGSCDYSAVAYGRLEETFLSALDDAVLKFSGGNERTREIAGALSSERHKLRKLEQSQTAILAEIEAGNQENGIVPAVLSRRLLDIDRDIKAISRSIANLVAEHKASKPQQFDVLRKEYVAVRAKGNSVERLNSLMRAFFERIELDRQLHEVRLVATFKQGPVLEVCYNTRQEGFSHRYIEG